MFITTNNFFALVVKRKFGKVTKILKILCPWLSAKFLFAFYGFINSSNCYSHILPRIDLIFLKNVLDQAWAPIVINSHNLTGIYFIFLKNVLDQSWRSFKTEFGPQRKYQKKSYQVRQNLAHFCNLVALILGWYCVQGFMVAKFIIEIGFPGASWVQETVRRDNYLLRSLVLSPLATHETIRIYQIYY